MYDNNADLGGGLKLKDYLDAEVAESKAGVQTNINNVDKAVRAQQVELMLMLILKTFQ